MIETAAYKRTKTLWEKLRGTFVDSNGLEWDWGYNDDGTASLSWLRPCKREEIIIPDNIESY